MSAHADPTTLDQLIAHREWVRRLARTMTHDDAAADDLVQDAYVAALAHPPRHDGWRAWMRRVLRNRSRNLRRESCRRAAREAAPRGTVHERAAADVVAEADAHRHVVDAVMDLGEPLRTTVLLRYFEDLPAEAVALRTAAPLETTRSRLRRAREILRTRLDREHGGRSAWCAPLLAAAPPAAAPPDATDGQGARRASAGTLASLIGGLIVKKSIAALVAVVVAAACVALVAAGSWRVQTPAEPAPDGVATDRPGGAERAAPSARARARAAADSRGGGSENGPAGRGDAGTPPRERSSPAASTRRITGRVEDPAGRPVGDGTIAVLVPAGPQQSAVAAAAGAPPPPPSPPPGAAPGQTSAPTRVNSDGTFEMDVPDAREPVSLLALAAGFAPRREQLAPGADDVVVRLRRAVALRVRMLGPGGRPIAGRRIDVRDEVGSGDTIGSAATDADGFALFPGLPGGTLVSVRTSAEGRLGYLQSRVLLAADGESSLEFRDDGVRRLRVRAVVDGPEIPVSGLLVETSGGPSEIRAWPGGDTATFEIPAGDVVLALVTAAGRSDAARVGADADEVVMRVTLPAVRWIDVDVGDADPRFMELAGGRDARELIYAGDLTPFVVDGRLRLPLVEGAEYALRRPDGTELLLGVHTTGRVTLADPAPRVVVRVFLRSGDGLPAGTRVVATPVLRAVRLAGEEVNAEATSAGEVALSLIPGITYSVVVTAPGIGSARLEHRPTTEGGEVRVELRAGGTLRFRPPGVESGSKVSVVSFPAFARLTARIEDRAVVIDGVGDGWALVMAGGAAYLVQAGDGAAERTAPAVAGFAPEVRGNGAGAVRTFLVGLAPVADGVHAVGLVGVPLPIPPGRYVPVEWREGEVAVYAPIELSAASPA